jgi:phage tail tape-measure protein
MISMIRIITEAEKKSKSGYTRGDVAAGWGKLAGATGGGALGLNLTPIVPIAAAVPYTAGEYVGMGVGEKLARETISNPDEPADMTKRSHRIGAMLHSGKNIKKMAIGAGIGAAAGATIGSAVGPIGTMGGANLGMVAGGLAANTIGVYKAAKKLGYGVAGRIGSAASPLVGGFFKPKKQKQSQKESTTDSVNLDVSSDVKDIYESPVANKLFNLLSVKK